MGGGEDGGEGTYDPSGGRGDFDNGAGGEGDYYPDGGEANYDGSGDEDEEEEAEEVAPPQKVCYCP